MAYDVDVMENRVGLNLLYTQVRSAYEDKPTAGLRPRSSDPPPCKAVQYWITVMEQEGPAIYLY